jgi:hypothetical protein
VLPEPADTIGYILWGKATDISAEKAFSPLSGFSDDNSKVKLASQLLTELLSGGEVLASELFEKAAAKGIAEKTVRRAKTAVGIVSVQKGKRWYWKLMTPESSFDSSESDGQQDF